MKTLLMTCVYPGVEGYLPDFISSVNDQSGRDCDLLILNDGMAGCGDLARRLKPETHVLHCKGKGSPAWIRKEGIRWAAENGYDILVFADADDQFSAGRVSLSRDYLSEYGCTAVFHDLELFGDTPHEGHRMLAGRVKPLEKINATHIRAYNMLGLSNTAARVPELAEVLPLVSEGVTAFDWALFTLLLRKGHEAMFVPGAVTRYRQHGNNLAAPFVTSHSQVLKGVQVKLQHYQAMAAAYKFRGWARDLYGEYLDLYTRLNGDPGFSREYCDAVIRQDLKQPLWWEYIDLPGRFGLS